MGVSISTESMTSDLSPHNAGRWLDETTESGVSWVVSWLPLRRFDRNTAITAMAMAEYVAKHYSPDGHVQGTTEDGFHAVVRAWCEELEITPEWGLSAVSAVPHEVSAS